MIGFRLAGGLGNMLFQIIAGECLAQKYNKELCFPNVDEHFAFLHSFGKWVVHCDEYLTVFKNINWHKNSYSGDSLWKYKHVGFRYEEIVPNDGTVYCGYFQSEKNFTEGWQFVKNLLEPADHVKDRLDNYQDIFNVTTCSIHVRRGNYLSLPEHHTVQTMEYYNEAMGRIGADRYLVFSDDIEWCKQNFIGEEYIFIKDTDYIEMFLMSMCDHNIIGNSSFSWLGAYLGNPDHRLVVAPNKWFPNNDKAIDVIPDRWIKI